MIVRIGVPHFSRFQRMMALGSVMIALSACGKVAPNLPPDPYTYPRVYPTEPPDIYAGYFPEDPSDRLVFPEDRTEDDPPQYDPVLEAGNAYDPNYRAAQRRPSAWTAPDLLPPARSDGSLSLPTLQ